MPYTNPYNVNQTLNPNMALQLTTLDDNQEQLRQIVQQENEKKITGNVVASTFAIFTGLSR